MHPLFKKYGLKHLSASQIKTMKRSPFTWVCEKVLGMRSPATEATAFGTFIHENFEHRLKAKTLITDEVIITDGVKEFYVKTWEEKLETFWKYYKEEQPDWPDEVEHAFTFQPDKELPPFIGKIDALTWGQDGDIALIQDHKTIGNKAYAPKVAMHLADDDQLNIYAAYVFDKRGGEMLMVQHDQLFKKIKTKKNTVNILRCILSSAEVEKKMASILQDAKSSIEILEVYDKEGIEGVAHTYKEEYEATKWDFGGCQKMAFFEECLTKKLEKPIIKEERVGESRKWGVKLLDLHVLVRKAREYFTKKGQVKFELADSIVEATMDHIEEKGIKSVSVRSGMTNGGDLIYNQLLNRLAENGVAIYERIN